MNKKANKIYVMIMLNSIHQIFCMYESQHWFSLNLSKID